MVAHAFNYTNQEKREEEYECFDCGQKVRNKQELMSHKKEKHYKTRLCSFFHGTMTTCRFPNKDCLNIHNENIWPTETAGDYRGRINCKHGNSCVFLTRPGGCFYKHAQSVEPPQNAWQQSSTLRGNTEIINRAAPDVDRPEQPEVNSTNTPSLDMNQIVMNLSKQMETISQKLQFLELKSMQDFPTITEGQKRR